MQLTAEEKATAVLSAERLAQATRAFHDSGFLIIEGLYEPDFIATVRAAYEQQLAQHIAAKGGMEGMNRRAFGHSHIGMFLPMVEPFANEPIVAHPIVVQLLEVILGSDFRCSFYHSNTSYPGSGYQPTHRDNQHLFGSELGVAHPSVTVTFNVPLCDFTEQNGSTEVWPGSHLIVDRTPDEANQLEERAANMASVRTNMPVGAAVLRDLRTWHRGTPNRTTAPRAMLALVYRRSWLHEVTELEIPRTIWENWPERARQIFRNNPITEVAADLTGVTMFDLIDQGKLR
jgi:ectoine hydroxylase-related dioxygenase (phytanoyl-CoA dioxygenase family)